ncbi:MAG: hypothetical protein HYV60_18495 [Planctomycetia bacterium]|nr:hypothetical protein [Planctomycetia bacterium]
MLYLRLTLLVCMWIITLPIWGEEPRSLSFTAVGDRLFDFDTGVVRGQLRANGKYQGISSLIDVETGKELTRSAGIFSYYRVLSTDRRWGDAARDWPMTATLLPEGAVRIDWPAADDHPFEMTATYRWISPTTLDLETIVRPRQSMPRFEVFLSSYFDLNFKALAYAKPMRPVDGPAEFIMADVNPLVRGSYLAFPTDQQAAQMFFDRRWAPENGLVPWAVTGVLGAPLALKRDVDSDITFLLMSRPTDCFGLSMSYNMDPPDGIANHGSVYMSLFGTDIAEGESERAHVRLVVERQLSNQRAVELYERYTREQSDAEGS